jgi:hypothetical protein
LPGISVKWLRQAAGFQPRDFSSINHPTKNSKTGSSSHSVSLGACIIETTIPNSLFTIKLIRPHFLFSNSVACQSRLSATSKPKTLIIPQFSQNPPVFRRARPVQQSHLSRLQNVISCRYVRNFNVEFTWHFHT